MQDAHTPDRPAVVQGPLPLVGRSAELAWLTEALHDATAGRPRICLLAGEAGIGKTRLLRELRAVAGRAGATVCFGRTHQHQRIPYLCFEPLLARIALEEGSAEAEIAMDPVAQAVRTAGAAGLAASPAALPATAEDAGRARMRTFVRIAERTLAAARERVLVLVLDDLHWSDSASLDLLAHLAFVASDAADTGPVPLLVVATFRPGEGGTALAELVARLRREPICQLLELHGLEDRDVGHLLPELGVDHPAQQLVGALQRLTQGNPLFVQEMVHHLRREQVLEERSGAVLPGVDLGSLDLPPALSQMVAERVHDLPAEVRETLVQASFLGDRFDLHVLAEVCGREPDAVLAELEVARTAGLLTTRGNTFEFHHGLLSRALSQEPSGPRRQAMHRHIAETLERLYAGALEPHVQDIAHHWMAAGADAEPERVAHFAGRAAEQAMAAFAWEEATRYAEAALDAAARSPSVSAGSRAALHRTAGIAHYRNMDAAPALEHFLRARDAAEEAGDEAGVVEALLDCVHTHVTLLPAAYGTLPEQVEETHERLARLGPEHAILHGRAGALLSEAHNHARDLDTAARLADEAVRLGAEGGDANVEAHGLLARGWVELQRIRVREAADAYRACLEAGRRGGDPWIIQWPLQRLPLPLVSLGRIAEAEAAVRDALTLNRQVHDWADHSLTLGNLCTLALLRGDLFEVEAHAREAMQMVRRTGYPWGGAMALIALATARRLRGEVAAADDAVALLLEPGRVFPDVGPDVQVACAVLRLANEVAGGQPGPDAVQRTADLMALLRAVGLDLTSLGAFCALLEAAITLGALDTAAEAARALAPLHERGVRFTSMGEFCLPRLLGRVAAATGDTAQAAAHFAEALEVAREAGAETHVALSRLDEAATWLEAPAPARERAAAALRDALPRLHALGMGPAASLGRNLAARLGAQDAVAVLDEEPRLTRYDRDLLGEIAAGHDHGQMASRLLVSDATVRAQCDALLRRIGVRDRRAATAWAVEHGLLGAEDDPKMRERARRRTFLPPPAPAAHLTLLVSDVVDFTETLQERGEEEAQRAIQAHNRILRGCLERHLGREIQHTGDGMIAAFGSSAYAVECACAMQRELASAAEGDPDHALSVRIGLHAGNVRREEDRLFGNVMNAAARICAAARGGEVLCSETVHKAAAGTGLGFAERGPVELKGFEAPYLLYRVRWEEAASDA